MSKALQVLEWNEVAPLVHQVNPTLANLIDKINPDKHYPLIKVRYSFGDLIVKEGLLQIPNKNGGLQVMSFNMCK